MAIKELKCNNPSQDHMKNANYRKSDKPYIFPIIYSNETWKPIILENIQPWYYISNYGRIYSKLYDCFLRFRLVGHGYYEVTLRSVLNTKQDYLVHRLVLLTFNFIQNHNEMQVNHINGIKSDNRLENLEWCTCVENIHHAISLNLYNNIGENNSNAKLSNEQVHIICKELELHKSFKEICSAINEPYNDILISRINQIKMHKTWNHISNMYNF